MKSAIKTGLLYALALTFLTLVALWRIPWRNQGVMWAEDGNIFIASALDSGGLASLFKPYAGYLHFVPRLGAAVVVRLFDMENYAVAMSVLACVAVAAVALGTFYCSKALTANVWVRAGWAAIPILVNVGAVETLGNFANFHWYLLWLAPWLLLKPAKSVTESAFLCAAAAAVSLTEIISILFVPLMLFQFKNKRYWPARVGLIVGLLCQISTTLTFPRPAGSDYALNPVSVLIGWPINTAGPIFYGDARNFIQLVVTFGIAPLLVATIALAAVIALALAFGGSHERLMIALFTISSATIYSVCVVANRSIFFDYVSFHTKDWLEYFSFTRYAVVPTMFILAVVPTLVLCLKKRIPGSQQIILTSFAFLLAAMYFVPGTNRDGGPVWADQVDSSRSACAIGTQSTAVIKVAPHFYDGDVLIACKALEEGHR